MTKLGVVIVRLGEEVIASRAFTPSVSWVGLVIIRIVRYYKDRLFLQRREFD